MTKLIFNVLRWAIPAAILAYLFYDIFQTGGVSDVRIDSKNWYLLVVSVLLLLVSTVLGVIRWYLLVLALQLKFSFVRALQLGFLGELFNLLLIGSVGGDVVKAYFLAREQSGQRAKAVSTVLIDRVIGFYSIFLLASIAILLTGTWRSAIQQIQTICLGTILFTAAGTIGLLALASNTYLAKLLADPLSRLPYVGSVVFDVAQALGQYRRQWQVLVTAVGLSFGVHLVLAVSVYCIALSMANPAPSLSDHAVIMPLATTTGVLPLPNGLGAFELVLKFLYQTIPDQPCRHGLLVALGYRAVSLAMAAIGAGIYFATQSEVSTAIRQLGTSREEI